MDLQRWAPLLVLAILVGAFLRLPLVITVATAVLVILTTANWWKNRALQGVSYRRKFHYTRAFPGEVVPLQLEVENRKLLPISWLRIEDPWPKAIGPEDESLLAPSHIRDQGFLTNLFSLSWYKKATRRYTLIFRRRGYYTVGPARLESGDLFGIYEQSAQVGAPERLTVFPNVAVLSSLEVPAENPFGERRSRRRLFEDPNRPMGIREYHPEDGFRRVHWPATARTGQLQVKIYQPTSAPVMMVCLNVSTFSRHWEGVNPDLLERLVSVAAALVQQGIQDGLRVGMISNGCLLNSDQPFRIPPGRSPGQLAHLLEALAGVSYLVTAPFERFLLSEAPRVPYGASLVILTAIVTNELAETVVSLKRHERRQMLVTLAEQPPPELPGVTVVHLPYRTA